MESARNISERDKSLYFDKDNRINLYQINSTEDKVFVKTVKEQALSIACIIPVDSFKKINNQYHLNTPVTLAKKETSIRLINNEFEPTEHPIGNKVKFANEPAPGLRTAFLIEQQLALTAAHCVCHKGSDILNESEIKQTRLVFGFQMLDEKEYKSDFDLKDVCKYTVIAHRYCREESWEEDWALLKLDRPIEGRPPLKMNASIDAIANVVNLYMLGHPMGLPLKFTGNGILKEKTPICIILNVKSMDFKAIQVPLCSAKKRKK